MGFVDLDLGIGDFGVCIRCLGFVIVLHRGFLILVLGLSILRFGVPDIRFLVWDLRFGIWKGALGELPEGIPRAICDLRF